MTEIVISFPCGDLSLEGVYTGPQGEGPFAAVAVCHPHPIYGGMMDNNVVIAVCRALSQVCIASLRFNFRGVGRSQGMHGNGIGEQDDVAAALRSLASTAGVDRERIGLCGYSFGAGVALEVAAKTEQVKALALVSPVLSPGSPIQSYERPKLLLWGSKDLALPAADLASFTEGLPDPKQYEVVSGADHFWWGYEGKVGNLAADFFSGEL
jgi:alpha/beta superfamily hydrolase